MIDINDLKRFATERVASRTDPESLEAWSEKYGVSMNVLHMINELGKRGFLTALLGEEAMAEEHETSGVRVHVSSVDVTDLGKLFARFEKEFRAIAVSFFCLGWESHYEFKGKRVD